MAAVGPTRVPFLEKEASEPGTISEMDAGRSMRAVDDNQATPLSMVEQLDMSAVRMEALQSLTASTI
jgi:hypothetical protein